MSRVRHSVGWTGAIAALTALAACGPTPRAIRPDDPGLPVRSLSAEELAQALRDASAPASLKGSLTLGMRRDAAGELRTCHGVLAARSPWTGGESGLYVKGYRSPAPTLFTLVSDGHLFWLHVPHDNVVYTGPVAARRAGASGARDVPLDARDLFRALFVQPLGGDEVLEVREEPDAYVVSALRDGTLRRRLWVERRRLSVAREVFYDASGREEVSIERDGRLDAGGRPYPERLLVRDAASGSTVLLQFERVTVDPADLGADAFRPRLPADARTQRVAAAEGP